MRGSRPGPPQGPNALPGIDDDLISPGARRYEALGRVLATLAAESEMVESCRELAWWRGTDHSWHIEWRDGLYAFEVAALLAEQMRDPAIAGPLAAAAGPASRASAALDVMGVRFALRAVDPLGRARLGARPGLWRLTEALDTSRPRKARHAWEELLGG
ncbi:hypothetical protein [Spongiactinospora sp. TRM90649]|uniref:hypothetical protein n=1 Tax=Spongiactinospora sp. TRM90649 TaxID=3031114 RepID=UPI0023F6BAAF|nr:hypothetical protein [Spongiactinospora sp. TRM90649]MDF5753980.1 hypothetical protein [Spongiactinospora sp. TRM90649]